MPLMHIEWLKNSTIRDRNDLLYTDTDDPNAEPVSVLPNGGFLQQK